jgi:signal transduction histidine kinase
MRPTRSDLILDQISISLRWLILIGLTLALGWKNELSNAEKVVLLATTGWNLYLTALSIRQTRLPSHQHFAVGFDLLITLLLFLFAQLLKGSILLALLLPAFTAAIYFGLISRKIQSWISRNQVYAPEANIFSEYAQWVYQLEREKARITNIQTDARKKLARDLHDGPTPSAAALAMRVNFVRRLIERDGSISTEELLKTEELARQTTKEIRYLLFTLHPLVLETAGLVPALEAMGEKIAETYAQQISVEAPPEAASDLEIDQLNMLFYIVEEAVSNARKHADAKNIYIRVTLPEPDVLQLEIEDDGIGFNPEELKIESGHRGSPGLEIIRQRTALLKGLLKIDSEAGQGTRIRVQVPLSDPDSEGFRCDQG